MYQFYEMDYISIMLYHQAFPIMLGICCKQNKSKYNYETIREASAHKYRDCMVEFYNNINEIIITDFFTDKTISEMVTSPKSKVDGLITRRTDARNAAYDCGIGYSNAKEALRQSVETVVNRDKIANLPWIAVYGTLKKQKKLTAADVEGVLTGINMEDVGHGLSKRAKAINAMMGYGVQEDKTITAGRARASEYLSMSDQDDQECEEELDDDDMDLEDNEDE